MRHDELLDAVRAVHAADPAAPMVLGSAANARAVARVVAGWAVDRVTLVAVPDARGAVEPDRQLRDERTSADAWWAAGLVIRLVLEELDRAMVLTDAAGMAVTLATGAELPADQLGRGVRWRRHLACGGHADDLRVASALHSIDVVPELRLDDGAPLASRYCGS